MYAVCEKHEQRLKLTSSSVVISESPFLSGEMAFIAYTGSRYLGSSSAPSWGIHPEKKKMIGENCGREGYAKLTCFKLYPKLRNKKGKTRVVAVAEGPTDSHFFIPDDLNAMIEKSVSFKIYHRQDPASRSTAIIASSSGTPRAYRATTDPPSTLVMEYGASDHITAEKDPFTLSTQPFHK